MYLTFYSGFLKLGTNEFIECRFCCTFAVGNLMFDLILITLKCIELFKWKVERGVVGSIATLTIACILSIAVNGCTSNDGIMRGWSNTMAWWHPNVVFTITVMVFCSICPQIANIDCLYPLTTLTPINIATGEMSRATYWQFSLFIEKITSFGIHLLIPAQYMAHLYNYLHHPHLLVHLLIRLLVHLLL